MASIMEIMQLCRLCLVKEQVNIPIFEDQGDIRQIFLKITACLPVKVSKEDQLPKKICDGCLYKLELLYQFWNTTANAEKQLLSWIEQSNMDLNSKPSEESSINTHPQVKQEKIEPTESTNENADLSADAQNYILQQQQLAYQANFPYKESQGSNVEGDDAVEDPEEPEPKRRRRGQRRQATKPIPPESLDSSDNEAADTLMEMTVTKTEEESESDGDENVDDPESSKFVTVAEDREQPGPSGLGKGTTEAPCENLGSEDHVKCEDATVTGVKSENAKVFTCKVCDKKFPLRKLLNAHKRNEHESSHAALKYGYACNTEDNLYSCKTCDVESKSLEEIETHVLSHVEKFECNECKKILFSAYKYALHAKKHTSENVFYCPLCSYKTPRRSCLQKHINIVHYNTYPYYCQYCSKGFHDVSIYREHESKHTNLEKIICIVCNKEFSYTRFLITHQLKFHRVSTTGFQIHNQCLVCKRIFSKTESLEYHMTNHKHKSGPAPKKFLCDTCGKGFARKQRLIEHYTMHTGEKPYKCSGCEKSFGRRYYLKLHERIHTGEKPYSCKYCGKCFNQSVSMKVHVRRHTSERPYVCQMCNKGFKASSAMKAHMNRCQKATT